MVENIHISDILKKYQAQKNRKGASDNQSPQPAPQEPEKINLSSLLSESFKNTCDVDSQKVYRELSPLVKKIYDQHIKKSDDGLRLIDENVAKIIDALSRQDKNFIRLCFLDYPDKTEYLYAHAVNVCIICICLGIKGNLKTAGLAELGRAALLHDIGMVECRDVMDKERALTKEEYEKVKEHPDRGFEILNRLFGKSLSGEILNSVLQEHERMDGTGYPKMLKGEQINRYAQIIGVADVYEAMTHIRPYRKNFTPPEAIKEILNSKNAFAPNAIKFLIEGIGFFPVGIIVRLNTEELGVVVKQNPRSPLRPTLEIIVDVHGNQLKEPKQIDLAGNSAVYIAQCLEHARYD